MSIKYSAADVRITYDNIKQEIYTINAETSLIDAHYELINRLVSNAERYVYDSYLITKTEYAAKSCLNRHSYANFIKNMQIETVEEVTYNSFKEPTTVVASKYALPRTDCDCPIEQTKAEYTYNDNRKLTEKKTTHCYCDCCEPYDVTVAVEKYYYDTAGELVRKESYVDGEELKTGINIEEHVFNDKGMEIKSFTCNSLDTSSKFYTENEVDENGKVLYALDESGKHKTVFDYERDGVTVKTERLPNCSKFAYGRDKGGTVTAITHSTETGEENSTTQIRTLDALTEIKSGNNTVQYTYNKMRRVKSVSLNGVEDYVTYAYSGEHTNAETITAIMADTKTKTVTTKNAFGNVTEIVHMDRVKKPDGADEEIQTTLSCEYNHEQQPIFIDDSTKNFILQYNYHNNGNLDNITENIKESTDINTIEKYEYDTLNTTILKKKTITIDDVEQTYKYDYKPTADKSLDSISVDGNIIRPNTDVLGRNTGKTIGKQYSVNEELHEDTITEEKISYIKF